MPRGRPNESLEPVSESKLRAIKKYQAKIKLDTDKYDEFKLKRATYMRQYRDKQNTENNLDLEEIELKIEILKLEREKVKKLISS